MVVSVLAGSHTGSGLTQVFKCFAELNQKHRVVVGERNVPPRHGTEQSSTELQIQRLLEGSSGSCCSQALLYPSFHWASCATQAAVEGQMDTPVTQLVLKSLFFSQGFHFLVRASSLWSRPNIRVLYKYGSLAIYWACFQAPQAFKWLKKANSLWAYKYVFTNST